MQEVRAHGRAKVEQCMDLNMEVLISRSPRMGESDSVAEDARTELARIKTIINNYN